MLQVCELHFQESDFITENVYFDEKTGKRISVPYKFPKLKADSFPTVHMNLPERMSTKIIKRENPDDRRQRLAEEATAKAIRKSEEEKALEERRKRFNTIQELFEKLIVKDPWIMVRGGQEVSLHIIDTSLVPKITHSVTFSTDLLLKVFVNSIEITKVGKYCLPIKVDNVDHVNEILNLTLNVNDVNAADKINFACDVLNSVSFDDPIMENRIKFITEQLLLINLNKHAYRYSSDFLIFASLLYSLAPNAYNFVRSSGNIILPHPSTIRRLYIHLNVDPTKETLESNFLHYIKQKFNLLNDSDKKVMLLMDEIHLKQFMDFKSGNVLGMAYNSENLANSAHVFMIKSLLSKYKDVVHIVPVKTIKAEDLFDITDKIIRGLEEIGYFVFCVITDNNSINRKCVRFFANPPKASIVYPHPCDSTRPLFYMADTVHLLKCIRNNWVNQKCLEKFMYYPPFPDSNTTEKFKTAAWSALKEMHNIECNSLAKFGYNLNFKSLHPTSFEKQNVKLVLNVFNDYVVKGLRSLGEKKEILYYKDTADFIEILVNWWSIVNVKNTTHGIHSRNEFNSPLTYSINDKKFIYLNNFIKWLENYGKMHADVGCFSAETHAALISSTHCLLELVSYCTSELKLSYMLTGKFQTDDLESRFGIYRQLCGSQYNISVRQLYEGENKLRTHSLLKISSKDFDVTKINFNPDFEFMDLVVNCIPFNINISDEDYMEHIDVYPVIAYTAGYCVRHVLIMYKCDYCKKSLASDEETVVFDEDYSYLKNIDRGGLCYPQENIVNIVYINYLIVQLLSTKFENDFVKEPNQRNIACSLTYRHALNRELIEDKMCPNNHINEDVILKIIWSSTNIFLNNYCKKKNDLNNVKKVKNISEASSANDSKIKKRKLSTLLP